jgi:hypothetical protein
LEDEVDPKQRKEKGQSLTEAAVALPVVLLVLMGVINIALYGLAGMNASNAANYGARQASVAVPPNGPSTALNSTTAKLAQVPVGTYQVNVSGGGGRGSMIQVEVRYSVPNYLSGLMSLFSSSTPTEWTGTTVSWFRQEGW